MIDDPIRRYLANEAESLLSRAQALPENFMSFLEGATQTLNAFNSAGHLARYGEATSSNLEDLREGQVIVFMKVLLNYQREFKPVIDCSNYSLLEVCKRKPGGHPVHIVGEEALNYRFDAKELETMRGLGLSASFYIQGFDGLATKYGETQAKSFSSYCDVKMYAGLNDEARSAHVSKMLASKTVRSKGTASGTENPLNFSIQTNEHARPLMTPDEVRAMPATDAWVFASGVRPIKVELVTFASVSPWRDEVGPNPISAERLKGKHLASIDYEGAHAELTFPLKPKPSLKPAKEKHVPLIRARNLAWAPMLAAAWLAATIYGSPHLLWTYKHVNSRMLSCRYVGAHSQQAAPVDGECPAVRFFSSN